MNIATSIPNSLITPKSEILRCENFCVQRGDFILCEGVNLCLSQGDICHLQGANGTGKTTFIMQLAGLLPIDDGQVFWRQQMGLPIQPLYIAHQLGIHLQLTVEQNLQFLLALYGQKVSFEQLQQGLAWVGLSGYENVPCYQLSAGQTRRVGLARLYFAMSIPLWILDEPLTALDTAMIGQIEQLLQDYANQGGAVLLTSHQPVSVANQFLDLSQFI